MEEENRQLRQEVSRLAALLAERKEAERATHHEMATQREGKEQGSTRRMKKSKRKDQQLQKMHATTREFFRMVYFLFSKLRDKALFGPGSPSLISSPSLSGSTRKTVRQLSLSGPELVNIRGQVVIGKPTANASLTVKLRNAPDIVAQMAKDVPKARGEAIVFSLSFVIKDAVDDFELGELSGSLRDITSTAGKNFQCTHKIRIGKGENGERLFVIVVSFEQSTLRKELQMLLASFEDLYILIEGAGLKHYASDKGPFLRSMINHHRVQLALSFRKSLLKIFKDPTSSFGHLGEQLSWLLPWVSLLRQSDATINFGDLVESVDTQKANKARKSITNTIRDVMPDAQPVIKSLYSNAIALLQSPHALYLQYKHGSDRILQIEAKNLILTELLPTGEDIKQGIPHFSLLSVDRHSLPPFILEGLQATYTSLKSSRPVHFKGASIQHKSAFFKHRGQLNDRAFRFRSWDPWAFTPLLNKHGHPPLQLLESFRNLEPVQSEGKSGSSFFVSADRRYIVKTITNGEWRFLRSILPYYLEHMERHDSSLLCKILGLHALETEDSREFFVVMANVLSSPDRQIHGQYDLKGAAEGRDVQNRSSYRTQRDLNFKRKLYLGPFRNRVLEQLAHDCKFLESRGIMDYSFFVCIHQLSEGELSTVQQREVDEGPVFMHDGGVLARDALGRLHEGKELYYFGVIDLMQPWTLRKVCESKIKGVLFAQPSQLSAVEPVAYSQRFQQYLADRLV